MMNIYAAWIAFLVGVVAGIIPGLFFHNTEWLGGYASWRRRLIRLAYISFFGLGGLNLAAGLTARALGMESGLSLSAYLLVVGLCTMPIICYLSAIKTGFRNLFFIPALSVAAGIGVFLFRMATI